MPKKSDIRTKIDLAREAYRIAGNPDISQLYAMERQYGSTPYDYADPDNPSLTHVRASLLQRGIDYKYIILKFTQELTRNHGSKRAIRLIEWLKPGGRLSEASPYWQRKELKHDIKRLTILIREYEQP